MNSLTPAERIKFTLLSEGLTISDAAQAYIDEKNGGRAITPADYASTSGVIVRLDDDVWVNAPIAAHNANFVTAPQFTLDLAGGRLVVRGWLHGRKVEIVALFWLPPLYHGENNAAGEPYNSYAFTHADRVRISPIEGCAMTCKFCDLPYEFRYRRKSVEGLVDSVARAESDQIQPAGHVLISGGTPRPDDFGYVQQTYAEVINRFPHLPVDIMMVPAPGLLDVRWLADVGVNELSVNIEIFNRDIAKHLMRRKADLQLDYYLDFLADAALVLGPGRVRSMLVVGLEPLADTLAGVRAIAERGCVPVLSPFRPDESTPMARTPPPSAATLEETYLRSHDITQALNVALGPSCVPCSHNTLSFAQSGSGDAAGGHRAPNLV